MHFAFGHRRVFLLRGASQAESIGALSLAQETGFDEVRITVGTARASTSAMPFLVAFLHCGISRGRGVFSVGSSTPTCRSDRAREQWGRSEKS